jgi:hypothetical protein
MRGRAVNMDIKTVHAPASTQVAIEKLMVAMLASVKFRVGCISNLQINFAAFCLGLFLLVGRIKQLIIVLRALLCGTHTKGSKEATQK